MRRTQTCTLCAHVNITNDILENEHLHPPDYAQIQHISVTRKAKCRPIINKYEQVQLKAQ